MCFSDGISCDDEIKQHVHDETKNGFPEVLVNEGRQYVETRHVENCIVDEEFWDEVEMLQWFLFRENSHMS